MLRCLSLWREALPNTHMQLDWEWTCQDEKSVAGGGNVQLINLSRWLHVMTSASVKLQISTSFLKTVHLSTINLLGNSYGENEWPTTYRTVKCYWIKNTKILLIFPYTEWNIQQYATFITSHRLNREINNILNALNMHLPR